MARAHGAELATAVDKALRNTLQPVGGPLRASFERVNLAFAPAPSREEFERRLQNKNAYVAREMLAILDRDGKFPTTYPYPIQVWRFGRDLTWLALGGEVVADYVQVVAFSRVVVAIRKRISAAPEDQIQLGIIDAVEPGRSAADVRGFSAPGLRACGSGRRTGFEGPEALTADSPSVALEATPRTTVQLGK